MLDLYDMTQFQLWLEETNNLHRAAHLETNAPVHRFIPFSTPATETSRYYLYRYREAGLCGLVELIQLTTDQVRGQQKLRRGTWVIKDSYFFLPDDHLYSSGGRYEPLIRGFYRAVFDEVYGLSQREGLPFALTCHHSSHRDFALLGDVTFVCEWTETDWLHDRQAFFGLMRLSDQPLFVSSQITPQDTPEMIIPHALNTNFAPLSTISLTGG